MKAVKILGGMLLSLFGLVVLLYLVGIAINWNDQPPSPEAIAFQRLVDGRQQIPDAENAFVYQLGINAPADLDPREVGVRRLAFIQAHDSSTSPDSDPLAEPLEFKTLMSASFASLEEDCADTDRMDCARNFPRLAADWQPNESETLLVHRYRTMLGILGWREVVPMDLSAPLPAWGEVMRGQRLHLLALAQLAGKGEWQPVREGLQADSIFWRAAQRNAQSLIGRMIAVAGMRNHYFFANLILRELPANGIAAALPPDWQREFSPEDRSLRLVMAGELAFNQRMFGDEQIPHLAENPFADQTVIERTWDSLARPFLKQQATINRLAAHYAFYCQQFENPLNEYPKADQELQAYAQGPDAAFSFYNPVGTFVVRLADVGDYSGYALRAAGPEGMRRAALLVGRMRASGISADQVAGELAKSDLRDPFTDAPFVWDAKRQSVVFEGPESHEWHRHEFFY